MQIGDLSRTHVPQEMRDSAARQILRVLLVAGLMAGGSLALWLTGGSGSSAGGMVKSPEEVEHRSGFNEGGSGCGHG